MGPRAARGFEAPRLRRIPTPDLTSSEVDAIRAMLVAAFWPDPDGRFTDDDWEHALGGMHFVLDVDGEIVTHASVVQREIQVRDRPLKTGYVEAVATHPDREGAGYGSRVIADVTEYIRDGFELGALGTGRHHFYERLGWETWTGPSAVRTAEGTARTPDDDGYILVLRTPSSPPFELTGTISCEWRPADVW